MGEEGQGPRRQSRDRALNTSGVETMAALLELAYGGDALTLRRVKALRK